VIGDTLATTAVFDMEPSGSLREPPNPEGDRIGNEVAERILRYIARTGRVPADAAELDESA
jgi:hypothetical protein